MKKIIIAIACSISLWAQAPPAPEAAPPAKVPEISDKLQRDFLKDLGFYKSIREQIAKIQEDATSAVSAALKKIAEAQQALDEAAMKADAAQKALEEACGDTHQVDKKKMAQGDFVCEPKPPSPPRPPKTVTAAPN